MGAVRLQLYIAYNTNGYITAWLSEWFIGEVVIVIKHTAGTSLVN